MSGNVWSVLIGIAGTIALSETLAFKTDTVGYTNSMTAFLFAAFAVYGFRSIYAKLDRADRYGRILSGMYSFGFSFALVAGKQLHTVENFAVTEPALWIIIFVLMVFLWGPVWYVLQISVKKWRQNSTDSWGYSDINVKKSNGNEASEEKSALESEKKEELRQFLISWAIIFLCWIPVFLAFYPGAFVYDAQDEYVQVASRVFTTHHPLTHVLMLGGFVCLGNKLFGSYNIGIALYTIVQMVVLSGVFAYTVSYLRRKVSEKVILGITLFYGLFPVIPMYAVCSSKDTLFTAAFLLMLVQLYKISEESVIRKKDAVLLVFSTAAMMLFRHNGAYVGIVMALGMLIASVWIKEARHLLIRPGIFLMAGFLVYTAADTALVYACHADDSENQEILTVPIQQLARTFRYSPEVFSEEEKEILFTYIDKEALHGYDADLSDLMKANFKNTVYEKEPAGFWNLWGRMFVKKPVTYLNAWMMTSYGYWYPDTVINVYGGQQRFTFSYEDSSYFGFETELPGTRDSRFPWLEEEYRRMSLELYQQKVPVVSMLFSPGFLFWMYLGSVMICLYRRRYFSLVPLAGIFLLWGTAILGPTFLVRYVLILWFALPLWSMVYYHDAHVKKG